MRNQILFSPCAAGKLDFSHFVFQMRNTEAQKS